MARQFAMPCTRPPNIGDKDCENGRGQQSGQQVCTVRSNERQTGTPKQLQITFQVCINAFHFAEDPLHQHQYASDQTKNASEHIGSNNVVHKRIQGGVQADIALRLTSNFAWTYLKLTLHGGDSKKKLRFCVEMEHGSKRWSKPVDACMVRSWQHKLYTSVRAQFCKEYYGQKLQFKARIADLSATTETPIVLTQGI